MRTKAEEKEDATKEEQIICNVKHFSWKNQLTNSVYRSTSSAVSNFSACQESSHTFWLTKVHHRVHNSPSHHLIWRQIMAECHKVFSLTHQRPNLSWQRAIPDVVAWVGGRT